MANYTNQRGLSAVYIPISIILIILGILGGIYVGYNFKFTNTLPKSLPREQVTMPNDTTEAPKEPPKVEIEPSCDLCNTVPVVVFSPGGLFSSDEKAELKNKMADPFADFNTDNEIEFLTIYVEKLDPVPAHGYQYDITAITKSGGYMGFLFGQSTPLEWWLPDCMGDCNLSSEFETKYPEIADQLD